MVRRHNRHKRLTQEAARFFNGRTIKELLSSIRYKLGFEPVVDSDQPAQPRSLIRVFGGRSMGNQASNLPSDGKLRLIRLRSCAEWFESLLSAHDNLYLMLDTGSIIVYIHVPGY